MPYFAKPPTPAIIPRGTLRFFAALTEGGADPSRDLVGGVRGAASGGTAPIAWSSGPWGREMAFGSTAPAATFAGRGYTTTTAPTFTLAAAFRLTGSSTDSRMVATSSGDNGLTIEAVSGTFQLLQGGLGRFDLGVSATIGPAWAYAASFTLATGAYQAYLYNYATGARSAVAGTAFTNLLAGDGKATLNNLQGGSFLQGNVSCALIDEQAWSATRFAAFVADPFAPVRRRYLVALLAATTALPSAARFRRTLGPRVGSRGVA